MISIILPTYNEKENIVDLINEILNVLIDITDFEILVIDDDSPDNTANIVKDFFSNDKRVKVFKRKENKGLANSIKFGFLQSKSDKVMVMDTDFNHDPKMLIKMIAISKYFDLVSGSRFCAGGYMLDEFRYFSSLLFNFFLRIILRTQIQDNLSGFFIINRKCLDTSYYDQIFYGYGDYYMRLLYVLNKKKFSIVEIPTVYNKRKAGKSKSNFFKMIFTYTISAIKIKYFSSF